MYRLGEVQELEIKRLRSVGAFLEEDLLLPKKEISETDKVGDKVQVFVYKDNENRPIATKKIPLIELGKLGRLRVIDTTRIGAFLDWGLDKDLLLPFHEQTSKPEKGQELLVALYLDKSERFCATMKIKDYLETDSSYQENDWVKGTLYSKSVEYGAFVAVDNRYEARIDPKNLFGAHYIGEIIEARVSRVQENGRLDLVLQDRNYLMIDTHAQLILNILRTEGELKLNDKSDPEEIKDKLSVSKGDFKRAVGRLLKQNRIIFTEHGIREKK